MCDNLSVRNLDEMKWKDLRRLSIHHSVYEKGDSKVSLAAKLKKIFDYKPQEGNVKIEPGLGCNPQQKRIFSKPKCLSRMSSFNTPLRMSERKRTRNTLSEQLSEVGNSVSTPKEPIKSSPKCNDTFIVQSRIQIHKQNNKPQTSVMALLQDNSSIENQIPSTSGSSGSQPQLPNTVLGEMTPSLFTAGSSTYPLTRSNKKTEPGLFCTSQQKKRIFSKPKCLSRISSFNTPLRMRLRKRTNNSFGEQLPDVGNSESTPKEPMKINPIANNTFIVQHESSLDGHMNEPQTRLNPSNIIPTSSYTSRTRAQLPNTAQKKITSSSSVSGSTYTETEADKKAKFSKLVFHETNFCNISSEEMTLVSDIDHETKTGDTFLEKSSLEDVWVAPLSARSLRLRRRARRRSIRIPDLSAGGEFLKKGNISQEHLTLISSTFDRDSRTTIQEETTVEERNWDYTNNAAALPPLPHKKGGWLSNKENISAEHLTLVSSTFDRDSRITRKEETTVGEQSWDSTRNAAALPSLPHRIGVPRSLIPVNLERADVNPTPEHLRPAIVTKSLIPGMLRPAEFPKSLAPGNVKHAGVTKSLIPMRVDNQKLEKQAVRKVREVAKATGIIKQRTHFVRGTSKMNREFLQKVRTNKRFELQMLNRK